MDCCVRSCYCICLIVLFVYCGVVWWYWRGIDCGIDCCVRAMSPKGGYSCIAQGASPGLIIGIYLLSPFRGGTFCASIGCGRYVVLYLSVGAFACEGKCRSLSELNSTHFQCIYFIMLMRLPWKYKLCMNLLVKKLYLCRKFKGDNTSSIKV